jgi:hypothetical protein
VRSGKLGFDPFEHWQISLASNKKKGHVSSQDSPQICHFSSRAGRPPGRWETRNELLSSSEALLSGHRRYPFREVIFLLRDLGLAKGAIELTGGCSSRLSTAAPSGGGVGTHHEHG